MKKVVTLITLAILVMSFLVLADNNDAMKGNGDSGYAEQEQHQGDSIQNQEQNEMKYELKEHQNLTQAQVQNIIQIRNRLHAEGQNGSCPQECECEGVVTKCELENGTRRLEIHAGNSGNIIVQVKEINASTQVQLYKSDDGKVYGRFMNNETKEIILPDEVKDRIQNRTKVRLQNESINLTEDGTYSVQARKQARLLWMIPVKEKTQFNVDAETGEIIRTRTSWWGFLAKDV